MILRWVTLLSTLFLAKSVRFETDVIKENLEQGRLKYKEYKEASKSDKTGSCWATAIVVSIVLVSGKLVLYSFKCRTCIFYLSFFYLGEYFISGFRSKLC